MTDRIGLIARSIALAAALLMAATPLNVRAQNPGSSAVAINPVSLSTVSSGDASFILSRFDAVSQTQIDVLLGRDTSAPYQLSWKFAHVGTETVERNGVALHSDQDYTIDLTAGSIAFKTPLRSGEMARVTYLCDTLNATPNNSSQSLPLQFDIWQSGPNYLRFTSLCRFNATTPGVFSPENNTLSADNSLQFKDAIQFLPGSTATTGLFLNLQGNDWLRRSGLLVGDQTRSGMAQLGVSYSQAGSQFAQSSASGITAGREMLQATGTLTPLKEIAIKLYARQTTLLIPPSGVTASDATFDVNGNVTREAGGSLAVTLPRGAAVTAARTMTEQMPVNGDGSQSIHDNLTVASPVAKGTQATIGFDSQSSVPIAASGSTPAPTTTTYTQTTTVGIKSAPNKFLTVTGSFLNNPDPVSPKDDTKVTIVASPIPTLPKLKLTTSIEDQYQKDGVTRNRSALIDLPTTTLGQLHLSGGVQQSSSPGKELNVGLVNASAKPLRYLEISGGARLRDGTLGVLIPDPQVVNTYTGSLALSPVKSFKITGDVARNPESATGAVQHVDRQALGLQANWGLITFKGQYGVENDYINARLNNTANVAMDLHLTRSDTLSTSYKLQSLFDKTLSGQITYQLGFTHKVSSIFDLTLSGLLTTYDQDGRLDPDRTEMKAQAKLGLHF